MNTGNTAIDLMLNWMKTLLVGFAGAGEFITKEQFNIEGTPISILTLCTFGGIATFLTVAVIKWIIT